MIRAAVLCVLLALPAAAQTAGVSQGGTSQAVPAQGGAPHGCIRPAGGATCVAYDDPYNAGCGTRGGPGCRKDNGHCAAWRDGFAPDCRQQRPAEAAAGPAPRARPAPLPPARLDGE